MRRVGLELEMAEGMAAAGRVGLAVEMAEGMDAAERIGFGGG